MTNLKNIMTAILMAAVLMVGTTSVNAGMLMSDRNGNTTTETCSATTDRGGVVNGGILVAGFTGILVAGFTGILVAGLTADANDSRTQTQCRGGILLSD